ncbi:MAG: hypothetical protein WC091_16155 [Sulfuricellaceae bacterium]
MKFDLAEIDVATEPEEAAAWALYTGSAVPCAIPDFAAGRPAR